MNPKRAPTLKHPPAFVVGRKRPVREFRPFAKLCALLKEISQWDGCGETCPGVMIWNKLGVELVKWVSMRRVKRRATIQEAVLWMDRHQCKLRVGRVLEMAWKRMNARASKVPLIWKLQNKSKEGDTEAQRFFEVLSSGDLNKKKLAPWRHLLEQGEGQGDILDLAWRARNDYDIWVREWEGPTKHFRDFFSKTGLCRQEGESEDDKLARKREMNRQRQRRFKERQKEKAAT